MNHDEPNTQSRILEAGKREFLQKGFEKASLRNIVKEAGVTTGAFYGYYDSKEALFDALVGRQAEMLMDRYTEAQDTFAGLPPREQLESMGDISGDCMDWMVDYVYQNGEVFKLLICCAEGTVYENFIHRMVEIEVESTHNFIAVLKSLGKQVPNIDPQLEHILISGMLSAFFEMIIHDMPYRQAKQYVTELRAFYTAGWEKILGL